MLVSFQKGPNNAGMPQRHYNGHNGYSCLHHHRYYGVRLCASAQTGFTLACENFTEIHVS